MASAIADQLVIELLNANADPVESGLFHGLDLGLAEQLWNSLKRYLHVGRNAAVELVNHLHDSAVVLGPVQIGSATTKVDAGEFVLGVVGVVELEFLFQIGQVGFYAAVTFVVLTGEQAESAASRFRLDTKWRADV